MKVTDQQVVDAHDWYMAEPTRTIAQAAGNLGITHVPLLQRFKKLGLPSKDRYALERRRYGEKATNWSGGRHITDEGYVKIKLMPDDPYVCMAEPKRRYIYEHRYVMAQYLGRPLYDWETVHHTDGDKTNNDVSNLQLRIGKHGKGEAYACMDCGSRRLSPIALD